ncbi:MAG: PKD domain-containing protein, partial [Bacteroidia bacterium]
MKNVVFIIFALCCFCQNIEAQNIVAAEYFVNTDPGVGNGTAIPVTPAATVDQQFQVLAAFPAGINRLYVRVKSDAGLWSNTRTHFFQSMEFVETASSIVAAEYFIDSDPGPGNATAVSVTPGAQLSVNLNIPITIGEGIHRLYVRTKDQAGLWSNSRCQYFYVHPELPAEQITAAEYFVDTDPGVGNGTSIPVNQAASVNEVFVFNNPFDQGTHTLSVRVKSASGIWSTILSKSYTACSVYGPVPNFNAHVSGNQVILTNNSQYVSSFDWNFGDGNTSSTQVNPNHTYAAVGEYTVCLNVQNICGTDQLCKQVTIAGLQNISPTQAAVNGFAYINSNGFGF